MTKLNLLLTIPIIGIINILLNNSSNLPSALTKFFKRIGGQEMGLIYTFINVFIVITVWLNYNSRELGYQFISNIQSYLIPFKYEFNLGLDGISLYFIMLTAFTMPIMILSNWKSIRKEKKTYIIIVLTIQILLTSSFMVLDLFLFYIFFESILPPLFLLIKMFGSTGKVKASFHIFLYTLLGSLFMLIGFIIIYSITKTTDYTRLSEINLEYNLQKTIWILVFISIMVKSPLWPLTLWLKLAHAEAPLGGSVILAGVILKLALYAVYRIMLKILPEASIIYSPIIYAISIITIIYISVSCIRQIDLKVIIALSSISHIAVCILGSFSNETIGISGSLILALSHGFVSPAIFILLGGVLYDRYHTRIILYYRGLTQFLPLFSLLLFIFILGNMGTPLTGNFVGEFMALAGSFLRSPLGGAIACSSIFLSAAFSIYLFNRITGGIKSPYILTSFDLNRREFYLLLPLLVLTLITGIFPSFIQENTNYNISGLIYSLNF